MPPPQRTTTLEPIRFKDFRPGIADNPGANYASESATRANTWRCIANRNGALVPLPRRTEPFSMPHNAPDSTTQIGVVGIYVPPIGVLPSPGTFTPDVSPEHQLFVGTEWLTGGNRGHWLYRIRRFEAPGTGVDIIQSRVVADTDPVFRPSGMFFGSTRSNRADNTQTGCPVTLALWGGGGERYLLSWPDDQAPSSASPYLAFSNTLFILSFICHQGRTVLQLATAYGQGPNTITFMGENLQWSKVNNVGDWTANADPDVAVHAFPQAWVEENPSGYPVMASMSANELFAVKGQGGLYISGDLDNPTVVSLPMVTGGDLMHHPVVCELGVVYGSRTSGIWAWSHGDNSNLLSPQMDPDFWAITPGGDFDDFGGATYSFARCDDWVLVSNNFLFDTQLKSWWRLEDPTILQCRWITAAGHFIYGAESYYTNVDDQPVHLWTREDKTSSYSWQSQPIWQSVADVVNVNTVEVIAEGQGTITLTLTALNGDSRSITVTLTNCGFPERFREAFAIQGKYLQARIEADSGNSALAASTVYSVTLYPYTEAPVGHTL